MRIHACVLLVIVLAGISVGGAPERMDALRAEEPGLLIAGNEVVADVEELCCVLAVHETRQVEELLDLSGLRTQVIAKLRSVGIKHIECKTGLMPRLVLAIEAVAVPEAGKHVYRVQTSLNRIVTFSNDRDMHVMAEVWRLRPEMKAVAQEQVADAIADTVLMQVEAFIGAREAALRLRPRAEDVNQEPLAVHKAAQQDSKDAVNPVTGSCPFVASRSSSVFHRADCRWARNIAEHNRVNYQTREEALKDGKRPCKSCRP